MKRKTLTKKIERLKARLKKDAKKLARLTQKLGAVIVPSKPATKSRKPSRRAKQTTDRPKSPAKKIPPARRTSPRPIAKRPATLPRKKKLNLTPERRAQLSAAMKARWAAKRAAAPDDNSQPPPAPRTPR